MVKGMPSRYRIGHLGSACDQIVDWLMKVGPAGIGYHTLLGACDQIVDWLMKVGPAGIEPATKRL